METFSPGDRVIAINTDLSRPICADPSLPDAYCFPDGPLKRDTVYHVENVQPCRDGHQGLFITGLRVYVGKYHIPWNSSRFRKVDLLSNHEANKRHHKKPCGKTHETRKTGRYLKQITTACKTKKDRSPSLDEAYEALASF
ncbi:MAG: hypothetical protein RL346_522 [Verrucomicrobiota bacterium]